MEEEVVILLKERFLPYNQVIFVFSGENCDIFVTYDATYDTNCIELHSTKALDIELAYKCIVSLSIVD